MFSLKVEDDLELCLQYENRAAEGFALIMENFEHIREWSSWLDESFTLEKAREYCRKHEKYDAENSSELGLRIIYRDKVVGSTGLHEINRRDKSAEIGYWLAKLAEGQGLVTKSVKRLLEYGFEDLKLNRIVIKCVPENLKSRAIPERLRFVQEGVEREGGWLHTRFVDHVVYSVLEKDWKKMKSGK